MTESCFTFQGNGYAMQQDIRNYDPRYLSLALEFKSFDANTLLFYGVNEYTVCIRSEGGTGENRSYVTHLNFRRTNFLCYI